MHPKVPFFHHIIIHEPYDRFDTRSAGIRAGTRRGDE